MYATRGERFAELGGEGPYMRRVGQKDQVVFLGIGLFPLTNEGPK